MKRIIATFVMIFAMSFMTGCAEVVETGHRGLEVRFGEVVSEVPLTEGLHWYNPITSNVIEMNVQTQKMEARSQAYTKDVQQATITYAINYNLDPSAVKDVYIEIGYDWADKRIPQVIENSLKNVIGRWNAEELIGARDRANTEVFEQLRDILASRDVVVTAFEIKDIEYTPEFEKSVEDKVIAAQRAVEEQNRTVQIEEQATQRERLADAEAHAITVVAEALAQNEDLVALEWVKKWNGVMPTMMMSDGGGSALINIPTPPQRQ